MVKGKLYLLLSALSLGKEIRVNRESASIDELFKELQELSHQLPKTIAMASQGGYGKGPNDRTPEPERAHGKNYDHSRFPPEVAAVLARTPRTGAAVASAYDSTAEYQNPILRGKAPLRQSPPRGVAAGRDRSRDRSRDIN